MTPNYEKAALAATEALIKFEISSTPIDPLPILKKIPGVLVVSYEKVSNVVGMDRKCVIDLFGQYNQDAFTSVNLIENKQHYILTYNQQLPFYVVQRALARELGHIILGHDGSRPEEVRNEEARCFALHFLCPRPLIYSVQKTGLRFTVEVMGNLTGCFDYCLSCMRKLPPVHVPAELNRKVRDQFMDYIFNFFDYQRVAATTDGSALADMGAFMEGYEE